MMPRIRLQERDVDMLHSLSVGRYLTVQALEWLHFPTWRGRWQRHQVAGQGPYYPLPNVYRRLEGLRAGGLVQTIRRSVERAALTFNRLADVYALTAAGAEVLMERRELLDTPDYSDGRQRSLRNLEHSVAIATLYAALRAELEYAFQGQAELLTLCGWQGDHLLARSYDRVRVAGVRERVAVLPDAAFSFALGARWRHYFVEVDRGTRPLDSWREKMKAYAAYQGSAALEARYGVKDFTLLVVASTPRRVQRIAETVVRVQAEPGWGVRFLVAAQVHPLTIREGWQRVGEVRLDVQQVAGRVVKVPRVTLCAAPLWVQREQSESS